MSTKPHVGVAETEMRAFHDAAYESQKDATVPADLADALAASPLAALAFESLGKTQKYAVILDLVTTRTTKTRSDHLRKAVSSQEARGVQDPRHPSPA